MNLTRMQTMIYTIILILSCAITGVSLYILHREDILKVFTSPIFIIAVLVSVAGLVIVFLDERDRNKKLEDADNKPKSQPLT